MPEPLATHDFADSGLDAAIAFFRRTRDELRMLRMVRVSKSWVRLFDINGDYFDRTVTWDHGSDVSPLAGQPVRPMFSARNTKLYSMQFTCEATCAPDFLWGRDASGSWKQGVNWTPSAAPNAQ